MKVSACLIVKNEAKCIGRCLASMKDFVDEIIVTDTGSCDDTKSIAKKYGARVLNYKWRGDFAAAKNFTKDKASGDWIVFLDADEYFVNGTAANIKSVIKNLGAAYDGFMVKMVNIDTDNDDAYIDEFYCTRLFKNNRAVKFKNAVHEELVNTTGRKNIFLRVDKSLLLLYHTGYARSRIAEKCRRNLAILLKEMKGDASDKYLYRYLADSYHGIGELDTAFKYAKMDIASGKKDIAYASRSYRLINNILYKQDAAEEKRRQWYEKSIADFSNLPDFYGAYAYYLYTLGEYGKATEFLALAFEKNKTYDDVETSTFASDETAYRVLLAILYAKKNDYEAAEIELWQALKLDKYYQPAFYEWLRLLKLRYEAFEVQQKILSVYNNSADAAFLANNLASVDKQLLKWHKNLAKTEDKEMAAEENYAALAAEAVFYNECLLLTHILEDNEEVVYLPLAEQRIYDAVKQKQSLADEDFEKYDKILNALLNVGADENVLANYLTVQQSFSVDHIIAIADKLSEFAEYALASEVYKAVLEGIAEQEKLFSVIERLAEALYYAGNMMQAREYFAFLCEETKDKKCQFFLNEIDKAEADGR
jgi:glycosyltransferase involved in cell wall biosynthesis